MDGARFDRLTKTLAAAPSRRGVLAGMLGAVGLFGIKGRAEAASPPDAILARGRCTCRSTARPPVNGVCPCPGGAPRCNGECCEPGKVCVRFEEPVPGEICADESDVVNAAPEAVWTAVTEADALAAWALPNDIVPQVGHRFRLWASPDDAGVMEAEIVELDPPRRAVFTWRGGGLAEPARIVLTLDPVDDGRRTRLRLVSESGPAACRAAARLLGRHWQRAFFSDALPRYLHEGGTGGAGGAGGAGTHDK